MLDPSLDSVARQFDQIARRDEIVAALEAIEKALAERPSTARARLLRSKQIQFRKELKAMDESEATQ